ncbi:MAG: hypothetical protein E7595_02135 [Ruminococcaceae bacterium]|nr:hypothetical protein [Oscillospiraceae bacterium]
MNNNFRINQKKNNRFYLAVALLVMLAVAFTCLASCGEETNESSVAASSEAESSVNSEANESVNNVSDENSETSENTSPDDTYDVSDNSTSGDESEEISDVSEESEIDTEDESSEHSDTSEPEPEILGSGTADDPYLVIPDPENMTAETFETAANSSEYYAIYRVGGMYLTIEDEDAYVICDGVKYEAKKGKVSFLVPSAMATEAIIFEIGNNASESKIFSLSFANIEGSHQNPEKVNTLEDEHSVSLEAEDSTGYYYRYVAEKEGIIKFAVTADVDSVMLVTNNRNSAQRTTEADGSVGDDGTMYVEIEVQAGDEIIINVGAKPNKRGKYPAANISWTAEYL